MRLNEIHLERPFYGSRCATEETRGQSIAGAATDAPDGAGGALSEACVAGRGHKVYPYLLRDISVARANQVWATDRLIPMARGFMYLVAVMDWYSRRVLSWRVSNTLDSAFCVEALEEALAVRGAGDLQHRPGRAIHLRGAMCSRHTAWRSAWMASWLTTFSSAPTRISTCEPMRGLTRYFDFYNARRRHTALDRRTPDAVYFDEVAQAA